MTDKAMPITGGCLCREIRYQATKEPEWVGYCHCPLCRKLSGAPVTVGVLLSRDAVTWTKGEPSYYRSSTKARRAFCPNCGGNLTWETPSSFIVLVGTLDNPEDIRPESHVYTKDQMPWLEIKDDLRRHPGHDDIQWPQDAGYNPATGVFEDAN